MDSLEYKLRDLLVCFGKIASNNFVVQRMSFLVRHFSQFVSSSLGALGHVARTMLLLVLNFQKASIGIDERSNIPPMSTSRSAALDSSLS